MPETETPGDGEETPGDGEETPGDGEETPGDGEETPGDGEETPGDGEEAPGDGEETPGDGEETPGDGEETPGDGEETPGDGEEAPGDGEETPGDGEEAPGDQPQQKEVAVEIKNGKATISTEDLKAVEENSTITIDLGGEYKVELSLSEEQVKLLKEKGIALKVMNKDMSVNIPSENLPDGDVKVNIERMKDINEALSAIYDFTISSGDEVIHTFKAPVTLEFNVTGEVDNSEDVKMFYFNEEDEKWELIGGSYHAGKVTAETKHFSSFAVFELEMDNAKDVEDLNHLPATEGGYGLPDTATNSFNLLIGGFMILLAGGGIILYQRRKAKAEN
ncbi:LPXTG cell wall anchor domain-containing protein [Metabacillus sp. HB246100]